MMRQMQGAASRNFEAYLGTVKNICDAETQQMAYQRGSATNTEPALRQVLV